MTAVSAVSRQPLERLVLLAIPSSLTCPPIHPQHLEAGRSIPSEYIIPICECLGTTADYLLTGKNPPSFPSPPELEKTDLEKMLIENFRDLNESQKRDIVNKTARMFSENEPSLKNHE